MTDLHRPPPSRTYHEAHAWLAPPVLRPRRRMAARGAAHVAGLDAPLAVPAEPPGARARLQPSFLALVTVLRGLGIDVTPVARGGR